MISQRASRMLLVFTAFAVGLLLFGGTIALINNRMPGVPSVTIGGPFKLTDQNGKIVTDETMKGKPFLVFFGFTHCPDICPTTLFDVSEIFRALGPDADRAAALFITVDPERDTPATMKDYLSSFDPHLRGLSGDQAGTAAVEKGYRVYAKKIPLEGDDYTMDHSAVVYLMDKNGNFVAPFNMKRKPEEAAADLRRYL